MPQQRRSIKKNYLYNVFYQIVVLLVPILTTPYLARVLGAENIGIYSYTISIVTYFAIFGTLGVSIYGAREIAYIQDDAKKRSKVFWEINILRCITVTISLLIFLSTFVLFNQYGIYFLILAIYLLSNTLEISWFFQGVEDFKVASIRSSIIRILSAASIFIFVKTSDDLWIYILIYSLTMVGSCIAQWICLPRYLCKVPIKSLEVKKHFKPTLSLFLPQIASQIYVVLDKVMIGSIITDKSELGYYEQGEKIIKMVMTIITSIAVVMSPKIASAYINNKKSDLKRYMFNTFRFTFLIAIPMIFGIIAVSDRFVPIFFGDGYEEVSGIMKLLSPIILIIGFGSAIGVQYLIPTKKQRQLTISYITGAIINVTFNTILIPTIGVLGAVVGTILAESTVSGLQLFFVRKEFKLVNIIKLSNKYLIASLVMFVSCIGLNVIIPDNTIGLCFIIVMSTIIYGAIIIILKEPLTTKIINKYTMIFIKKQKNTARKK